MLPALAQRGSLVKPAPVKSFGMSRGRVGRRTQRETSVAESNQLGDAMSVCGPTQIYRRALPARNNLFFRLYISVKVRSIFGATASVGKRRNSRASSTATALKQVYAPTLALRATSGRHHSVPRDCPRVIGVFGCIKVSITAVAIAFFFALERNSVCDATGWRSPPCVQTGQRVMDESPTRQRARAVLGGTAIPRRPVATALQATCSPPSAAKIKLILSEDR